MSTKAELDKVRKELLVAKLDDLAELLEEEIDVTGNKDEIIERILAAEKKAEALTGDQDDEDDSESDDQADASDDDSAADSEDSSGDEKEPEEGEIRIRALKTFETLVEGEKVLVCVDETVSLPETAALTTIEEGLAEEA